MTRDEVKAVMGEPTDTSIGTRKYPLPQVWKYDEVEIHFAESGVCLVGLFEDPEVHITLMKRTAKEAAI
jgi:hypothetical protein